MVPILGKGERNSFRFGTVRDLCQSVSLSWTEEHCTEMLAIMCCVGVAKHWQGAYSLICPRAGGWGMGKDGEVELRCQLGSLATLWQMKCD